MDYFWPVRETINNINNEVLLPCIGTEVDSNFLEWSFWLRFENDGFLWVGRELILASLARENDIVDIVCDVRPVYCQLYSLFCSYLALVEFVELLQHPIKIWILLESTSIGLCAVVAEQIPGPVC